MRIQFKMDSTGPAHFPGLARPVTVDTTELPEAEAAEAERLVRAARLPERAPSAAPRAPRAPGPVDRRQYTITVEDGGQSHTVQVTEPVDDPDLDGLLRYLRAQQKAARGPGSDPRPDRPG